MSRIIDGNAHQAMKFFRKKPAALSVLIVYVSRANNDNVAWPSIRGLARDTDWGTNACIDGRQWLVQHKALERVENYIRPQWRDLPKDELALRLNLDKAEYYRATGIIEVDSKSYPVLYVPVNQESDNSIDVLSHPTSAASDIGPDNTELNINKQKHDEKKPLPAAEKAKTPHNLMFEAICGVFGYDWHKITKSKRGQVNTSTKQLLDGGAVPDDIPGLFKYCQRKLDNFGPVALSTQWDDYKATRKPHDAAPTEPSITPDEMAEIRAEMFAPLPIGGES